MRDVRLTTHSLAGVIPGQFPTVARDSSEQAVARLFTTCVAVVALPTNKSNERKIHV
jgi:hypothetical protein